VVLADDELVGVTPPSSRRRHGAQPVAAPGAGERARRYYRPARGTGAYGRRALESEVGKVLLAVQGPAQPHPERRRLQPRPADRRGVLDVDEVVDALLLAAERVGLAVQESRDTIASGLRSGAAQPRKLSA